jgi:NAD-dependent DNA ligase
MSKKKDNISKDYLKKRKILKEYNKFYYDKDSPIVTDHEFDDLKKKNR